MSGALDGQVAVVTGASRGIGKACAKELAAAGATVIVNYSANQALANETFFEIIQSGGKGIVVRSNVSDPEQAKALIEAATGSFEKVDILVNNAGITRDGALGDLSVEDWDAVLKTDLSSAFYCTAAVVPGMRERNYGRIINMSATAGLMGAADQANYAAAKAGLIAFTKSAARELARNQITVNAICPGVIDTPATAALSDEAKASLLSSVPLGRMGTAEEIGALVRFLCTEGSYFTGSVFTPNGGQYM